MNADESQNTGRLFLLLLAIGLLLTILAYKTMNRPQLEKEEAQQVIIFPHPENAS